MTKTGIPNTLPGFLVEIVPGGKNVPRTVIAASETSVIFMMVSYREITIELKGILKKV